ncbi:MAG: slipin family protein, partial [Planctomycetes bacterium]|nr:slipin family protein [Planctomycetota bacterium]
MFKRVRIPTGQVGLKYRSGELQDVLQPGVYWIRILDEVRTYDRAKPRFEDARLEILLANRALRDELEVVDLTDSQRAIVFRDGRLTQVLGPGLFAFWNKPASIEIEVFDTAVSVRLEHRHLERILAAPEARGLIQAIRVGPHEKILVYVDGELSGVFGPGTYAYWVGARAVTYESVDLRERVLDVSGQEIMTVDKVTLRLNLVVT